MASEDPRANATITWKGNLTVTLFPWEKLKGLREFAQLNWATDPDALPGRMRKLVQLIDAYQSAVLALKIIEHDKQNTKPLAFGPCPCGCGATVSEHNGA